MKLKEDVVVVDIRRADELEKIKYKDSIHKPNELINEDLEAASNCFLKIRIPILIHC